MPRADREGKSERLSVYFMEAWQGDNVKLALEMEGCKTDSERSRTLGRWLAMVAASIIEAGKVRQSPPDPMDGLLLLSPPEEVRQEVLQEAFADSKPLPVTVTAEVAAVEQRHKRAAW